MHASRFTVYFIQNRKHRLSQVFHLGYKISNIGYKIFKLAYQISYILY